MRLGSPRFERATRRLVRRAVKASREMRKERRAILKNRRLSPFWNGVLFIVFLSAAAASVASKASPQAVVLSATLFCAGVAAVQVQNWIRNLYYSQDLAILAHHPMGDREFFAFQWRKLLTGVGVVSPLILTVFVVAAWDARHPGFSLTAVGAAALQVGVIVASALILRLIYAWWWKAWWAGWALIVAAVGILLFSRKIQATGSLEILLPTGWAAGAFFHAEGWILAILAGALTLSIPWLLARVRATYALAEVPLAGAGVADSAVALEMAREAAAWAGGARPTAEDRAAARASFDTRMEDLVRSREFLVPLDWAKLGWIERIAAFFMSKRQRLVAEFLTSSSPGWSRSWKRAVLLSLGGLALAAVLPDGRMSGLLVAHIAIAAASGLGVPGFCWPGFRLTTYGVIGAPFFGPLPLGLKEMVAVVAKVHLARCAAMLVPCVAIGALTASVYREDVLMGAGVGLYLVLLSVATAPAAIAARFLDLSRDGSRRRLQILWLFPFAVILLVAVPIAVVAPFATGSGIGLAVGWGVAFAASWPIAAIAWTIFRWGKRDFLRWYQPDSM